MPFEQTLKLHVLSKFCYDTQKVNPVFPHKSEAVVWKCSVEKVFLKFYQNSKENTCGRVSFLRPKACNFIKKETLAQVLSCEFCKISKNTFFYRIPPDDCFCKSLDAHTILGTDSLTSETEKLICFFYQNIDYNVQTNNLQSTKIYQNNMIKMSQTINISLQPMQ